DRWGRKPLLLAGAALFALAPVCYALAGSVRPFMAIRIVHGIGIAAFTTAYTAFVADLAPPAQRGETIGLAGLTSNLGLFFMPALGAMVLAQWGYVPHFLAAAGTAAVGVLLILPIAEPKPDRPDSTGVRLGVVLRLRPVWVAALASTGLAVAYGATLSFMAPLAAERGLTAAGAYFSAFAAALMLAQVLAGWLSDRIGRLAVAAPGLAVAALATAWLAVARSDATLLAAGAAFGSSWGLVRGGLDAAVVDAVSAEDRGTAIGLLYTCFDAGVGVGAFGLGVAAQQYGYATTFGLAAAWATVALVAYLGLGHVQRITGA
ncbi:MAG: MFS transporter, partial [Anaerolineae bacterium]|nr:MFS transporter [Anaerolineae bacterium]